MISILTFFSLVLSASATGVLLPLYVYPGTHAAAWAPVKSAVAAYPNVQWQIIINPASGPGTNPSSPYPDTNLIAGIKALNAYSNVQTLGYVDTAYGKRAYSAVHADINNYTYWVSYPGGDISMDGIFFDDVPSIYDFSAHANTQAPNETYYRNVTSYAYATIPSDVTPVVLNPGNPSPASFYDFSDTVVGFENTQAAYKGQTTLNTITNAGGTLSQTAILEHDVSKTLTGSAINSMVHTLKVNKVEFVYLTNDCCYGALNATLLMALASACKSA